MARDHARLLVSIWDDGDFLALTSSQQMTYLALCSSRDLSWCGVAPLLPQRWGKLAADLTEKKVRDNVKVLTRERFLIVDEDTAEVCVRSFIRHDRVMRQPNVVKAMVKAIDRVHSRGIQDRILDELGREYSEATAEERDGAGWKVFASQVPDAFTDITGTTSGSPSPNPFAHPMRKAS